MIKQITLLILAILLVGCGGGEATINVVVNAGAEDYIAAAAAAFNEADVRTPSNQRVTVVTTGVEAGDAVVGFAGGTLSADVWIPDNPVWSQVAAEQGISNFSSCTSVAESPLVIGMWRDAAELLGWPGRELGWLDIGSLAADASAWTYYSGGLFGDTLRLGHTHPGISGSGASTLLALVQAAEAKTSAVTRDDIQQPIVQASVGAFEGGVAWFSNNTEMLGARMVERGESYLGASIMYESTVLAEGRGQLVPIYPFEGTFMATHPACIDAGGASVEAAETFRDWLLGPEGQQLAVTYGQRPVGDADASSLLAFAGVDLDQPANVYAPPSADTIFAVQELWQAARKPIHLAMLLDTSGSMDGRKMTNMLSAAVEFVNKMGDTDYLTLIEFYTTADLLAERASIAENRVQLVGAIQRMESGGDTSLYDAIGLGSEVLARQNSADVANVLIVLTDGQDTSSSNYYFNEQLAEAARANGTTVVTIAYGGDADNETLSILAAAANGQFFEGDVASIDAIYGETSAAFGGSAGIGR